MVQVIWVPDQVLIRQTFSHCRVHVWGQRRRRRPIHHAKVRLRHHRSFAASIQLDLPSLQRVELVVRFGE